MSDKSSFHTQPGMRKHRSWDDGEAEMFTLPDDATIGPYKALWRAVLALGIKQAFLGDHEAVDWVNADPNRGSIGNADWVAQQTGLEFCLARARIMLRAGLITEEVERRVKGHSLW